MAKKTKGNGRSKGAISPFYTALKTNAALEHLDGLSDIHRIDVESNWRLLNPLESAAELEHASLLESYYFGGGTRFDLICNVWFGDNSEPISKGTIMPSNEWKTKVKEADDRRRNWRDGKRMRSAPKGDFSGNIGKIFCRLTPWMAIMAGKYLSRKNVLKAVLKVAKLLEKETGLKVLGAVIHRETDHDIHVHFVVSKIGKVIVEEKTYSSGHLKRLITKQRKIVREDLRKSGGDSSLKAVNTELGRRWEAGQMKDPSGREGSEYQTLDRTNVPRRGLVSMGQQHVSKTNLWEASGRDAAVAAVQEEHCKVSFRSVVQDAAAIAPDGDPGHKYIDYWLAKQWNNAVCKLLPEDVQQRLPEVEREAAKRYVRDGSSLSNPTLDAARSKADEIIDGAISSARELAKIAEKQTDYMRIEAEEKAATFIAHAEIQAVEIVTVAQTKAESVTSQAIQLSAKYIAEAKEVMTTPGILETAERLGFRSASDKEMRAIFENVPYSLETSDEGHFLSRLVKSGEESSWMKSAKPLKNALSLIHKIWPTLDLTGVIEKLVDLFPNRIPGIMIGLELSKNKQIWKRWLSDKDQPEINGIKEGKLDDPPV